MSCETAMPASSSHHPTPKPSLPLRALRGTVRLALTVAVIGGGGVAVWQGSALLAERAAAAEPPPAAPALPVATRPLALEDGYEVTRRFLGELLPRETTELGFELAGRVTEIPVEEGARVPKGAVIARLDTALLDTEAARLEASRAALEADAAFAERRLARQEGLQDRGFASDEASDQARATLTALAARLREVDAQMANVSVRRDKSVLRAPYSGRIARRSADTGSTVAPGTPIVRLVADGAAEVRVGLPLWVAAEPGTVWRVDIDGTAHQATLRALLPSVDPVTRTRTAILTVATAHAPFGTIAELAVPERIAARGAWVPRGALREGAPGVWTVLVADGDGIARAVPVSVLHTEPARVFVSGGLREGLSLITGGAHRIVPGQTVTPLSELPDQGA